MIVYKICVAGAVSVDLSLWRQLCFMGGWLKSRPLDTLKTGYVKVIRLGKVKLDEATEWRIARDLNLCPRCAKTIRPYFNGPDICYGCGCGYYDEMDIS